MYTHGVKHVYVRGVKTTCVALLQDDVQRPMCEYVREDKLGLNCLTGPDTGQQHNAPRRPQFDVLAPATPTL